MRPKCFNVLEFNVFTFKNDIVFTGNLYQVRCFFLTKDVAQRARYTIISV